MNEKILELGLSFGVSLGEITGVPRGEGLIVPVNKVNTYYDVKGCICNRAVIRAVVSYNRYRLKIKVIYIIG